MRKISIFKSGYHIIYMHHIPYICMIYKVSYCICVCAWNIYTCKKNRNQIILFISVAYFLWIYLLNADWHLSHKHTQIFSFFHTHTQTNKQTDTQRYYNAMIHYFAFFSFCSQKSGVEVENNWVSNYSKVLLLDPKQIYWQIHLTEIITL